MSHYNTITNAVKLVTLMEYLEYNKDIQLSPTSCRDILVDRSSVYRLTMVKRQLQSDKAVGPMVLPIIKHLLDDPNTSIRRLAVECLAVMGREAVDGTMGSPLPTRHRHLLLHLQ